MGVLPYTYADDVKKTIIYSPVLNRNANGVTPLAAQYNSSTISIPFSADFVERKYYDKFFGGSDIMAKIGGINATVLPAFGWIGPFLVMYFLYRLASILLFRQEVSY